MIPECADLITDDEVRESAQEPRYETIEDDGDLRTYALEHLFGPIGAETFDAAAQTEHCIWGIPNSGSMDMIFVAILTDQDRTELEAAFAEDFGATSHLGDSVMYEAPPVQGVSTVYRSFWFLDNVWVSHFSPSQVGVMASQILSRVHQSGAAAGS